MRTILLLTISNMFLNFAWYGHLQFRNVARSVISLSRGLRPLPPVVSRGKNCYNLGCGLRIQPRSTTAPSVAT
jgi:hypothetical protein